MLDASLSLKPVSETAETYTSVVNPNGSVRNGVLRVSTSTTPPSRNELLITHDPSGKGANRGVKHNISLRKHVADTAGNLVEYTVSSTITVANSAAITNAMVLDSVRQIVDFLVTTAPVTMDSTNVYALLRGEA